jgi:ElaB/YqjD/DUF883 family membrane-anchored ribosome-binding protein
MAERNTKGGDAGSKGDLTTKGGENHAPQGGDLAQLRQSLDEVRGSVAALAARVGEGAVGAGGRGLRQARQVAGEVMEEVADRADEGVAALRARIEDQPLAMVALAFFAGVAISGLVMGALLAAGSGSRPPSRRYRRPGGRR